jgi:hypothetical protein
MPALGLFCLWLFVRNRRQPQLIAHDFAAHFFNFAQFQSAQLKRAERDADQPIDLQPYSFDRAPNFAVFALS